MTSEVVPHESVRYVFSSYASAAEALLTVLEDARTTQRSYTFTGLSPDKILRYGLHLSGEVSDISLRVGQIIGASRG